MIGYWDTQLRNRIANAAYIDYFGVDPDQMHGMHIRDVLGPELYEKNLPYMRRALAGEEQLFDRTIIDPAGGTRYTQASYIPDMVEGRARGFFVLVTDITARRQAEQGLADAERRFRALFDLAPLGTFLISADGVVVDVNRAAVEMLGHPREWLVGRATADFTHPDDVAGGRARHAALLAGEIDAIRTEVRYLRADGKPFWAQFDACLLRTGTDGQVQLLGQIQDISARRAQQAELERIATHDALTGLLNRRGLLEELERGAARMARDGGTGALLVVDLDHFKDVNDTYGHGAGDQALAAVAALLRSRVRASDIVARHGGDEFAVILTETTLAEAEAVGGELADRIRAAALGVPEHPISASIGIAVLDGRTSAADALACADLAMYGVKRRGGDAIAAGGD